MQYLQYLKKDMKNWKKLNVVHFKVKLFYLVHIESSKLRAPTHVLNYENSSQSN